MTTDQGNTMPDNHIRGTGEAVAKVDRVLRRFGDTIALAAYRIGALHGTAVQSPMAAWMNRPLLS